jgi:hypothetical protein
MRIQAVTGQGDGLTCALVFSPVDRMPQAPRVLIERPDAKEGVLGRRGWAVASDGLRPVQMELRGQELWLMFGSEVSWHVQRGTPIAVKEKELGLAGKAIWPGIPRGRQPTMPTEEEQAAELQSRPATPQPEQTPLPRPTPAPAPAEEDATILRKPRPPEPEPPRPPERPVQPAPGPGRAPWLLLLVLLLAGGGAAGWWLYGREDQQAPVAAPAPTTLPVPAPGPSADPCLDLASVMTPACPPDRLAALPPPEQLRLAEGLLRQDSRQALGLALRLLIAAANTHGPSQLALGRLYDPASFRPGGAVPSANPGRALDLYAQAAAQETPGAAAARQALVALLRQEAAGQGEAADRARTILRQAGAE